MQTEIDESNLKSMLSTCPKRRGHMFLDQYLGSLGLLVNLFV
jgi:hypothetical protein